MLYIDTELYIEGSAHDHGGVGESESVGDRTIQIELSKGDHDRRKSSLNRPRKIKKYALPDIK